MKKLRNLLKNEKGQGMLEYVLLLGVVAILIVAFRGRIKTLIDGATTNVESKANEVFTNP